MADSELVQLADLQGVSLDQRLSSVAIFKLLDAADENKRPDLLLKAIELSPGNVRTWEALGEMATKRKLADAQTAAYESAIEKYVVQRNGLFAFDLFIRWGNPDLWHPYKGGEKPMVFSFLNAILKSTSFPPYNPWLAGYYLNYYYYGFVVVSLPIKLLGLVPAFAYNLVLPTLFSMTGLNARLPSQLSP
jgi:hypothetical protein